MGVVTRKTLVREVVAPGLDPKTTTLGAIAEPPKATIDASDLLADAFAYLEQNDYERVPVVEGASSSVCSHVPSSSAASPRTKRCQTLTPTSL